MTRWNKEEKTTTIYSTISEKEAILSKLKKIGRNDLIRAVQILKKYKAGKANLENRIISNEQWWKMRHWGEIGGNEYDVNRPRPASAWLFNSIANKHADAMDNIPEPTVLPREQDDETAAKGLSEMLPVVLERAGYEKLYSDMWWYKLKNGTACQAVLWDSYLDNGRGDIAIKNIDLLNLFWQPGIKDIEESRNVFYVTLYDNDLLCEMHPELKGRLGGDTVNIAGYKTDDNIDVSDKSSVIDWYYKKRTARGDILHYCRFVGDTVLYASEDDEVCEKGFYEHGRYPFVLDPLFMQEGSPCGFGYIDIMHDAQMYIDKLGQVILEHTVQMSRKRFFIKHNGAVREEEFADFRRPFVHVAGNLSNDDIREIRLDPLDSAVMTAMNNKIEELKETSGNRDFSQGGTAGGVTAASAIAALQEAGNKLSRDMIKGSYFAFTNVCYLIIELIRQFYDTPRVYLLSGDYKSFDNSLLKDKERFLFGEAIEPHRPVFDVICKAAKKSPFSKAAQNELAKELFHIGFFRPELSEQALAATEIMDFEGKENIRESIAKIAEQFRMSQTSVQTGGDLM